MIEVAALLLPSSSRPQPSSGVLPVMIPLDEMTLRGRKKEMWFKNKEKNNKKKRIIEQTSGQIQRTAKVHKSAILGMIADAK